jgi:signal transduction histidine kinase
MAWVTGWMTMFVRIKRQLALWYLAVILVVMVSFGYGSYRLVSASLIASLDHSNQVTLTPLATRFSREDESLTELAHELSELGLSRREHLSVLLPGGQSLYVRGVVLDPEPALIEGASGYHGNVRLRMLVVPLDAGGKTRGYLRIGRSIDEADRTLGLLTRSFAVMTPIALLIVWLGGAFLTRQALRPLAVILSHAQLALEDPALTTFAKNKLETIVSVARGMAGLVADLLTLGRADVGLQDQALEFSLAEVLEEEIDLMRPLFERKGLALELVPLPERTTVKGDPQRIAQVVRILLDNALVYTPVPGRATVRIVREGGSLLLSVCDTGPGVPPHAKDRVFERFHREATSRDANPDGSGLGLAIGRAIARAHRGDLTLVPPSTFLLKLPSA